MIVDIDTSRFETARQNMQYDEQLLEMVDETMICRIYEWPEVSSVTLPRHRDIPEDILYVDHSYRPTGGGIVFHNPGDVLMTIVVPVEYDHLPKSFKSKLRWVSEKVQHALRQVGCNVTPNQDTKTVKPNYQFCMSYPNPYEIYVNTHKVVGFAQRRFKDKIMIQSVIHLGDNMAYFSALPESYQIFFTKGLQKKYQPDQIIGSLQRIMMVL